MKYEIHIASAKEHLKVANEYDEKYKKEKIPVMQTAFRIVAAQNYFYAAVNAIEAVFAKEKGEHSFSHENRFRKLHEYKGIFSKGLLLLYNEVDRADRNRVAYRGENGQRYLNIKSLALKAAGEILE
ncbi:MAG: hypothetical protein V1734_04695 [Nanoarchaeota archaeon]